MTWYNNVVPKLTYQQSGVNYDTLDTLKRLAQQGAKATVGNLPSHIHEVSESRGESAYVLDIGDRYLAIVEEGLGTKAIVADEIGRTSGKTYYDQIAQDTMGTIVNDLITVGARPLTVMAYWSTGDSDWFGDEKRMHELVDGWVKACNAAGVSWGGGETPTLKGIVAEGRIELAGMAIGIIDPKSRLTLGKKLAAGDHIVAFESSGIHANGLTLARSVAEKLPDSYQTLLPDGRTYGESLLDPTILYPKLIQDIFASGVDIHYMSHITGHGWRKIMRHTAAFTYRITKLPPVPPVLTFIVEQASLDSKESYATFNMGVGYTLFVDKQDVAAVIQIAHKHRISAYDIGTVEKGEKQIIIEPLGVTYKGDTLQVRV